MDTIFLNFGNILFKLIFHPDEIGFAKNKIATQIKIHYKNFIIDEIKTKEDITINFFHAHFVETYVENKSGKTYTLLFKKESKNIIYTTHTISIYQFQKIIFDTIVSILPKKNMLMLHASAVKANGKAYIFLGNKGAGKSTTIQLLRENYLAIADDSVFLLMREKKYYFSQTPFHEKQKWILRKNHQIPLGGVFFLKKSINYSIKREHKIEVISDYVMRQAITDKTTNKRYFRIVLQFFTSFDKFYYLYFGKDKEKLISVLEKKF